MIDAGSTSEVVQGAIALAGLLMAYLGSSVWPGQSNRPQALSLLHPYGRWVSAGLLGIAFAVLAALLGSSAIWFGIDGLSTAAFVLLVIAFIWAVVFALLTALALRTERR